MNTPAEQLDQQFRPPPQAPPATNLTVVPSGIQSAYMAHTDNLKGAAASEQLDAAFPAKPAAPQAPQAPKAVTPQEPQQPATVAPGGQVDQAVQAEMQRLQQPAETVGARLDKQYGKDLPNVLRTRAEENLGIKQPSAVDKVEAGLNDVTEAVVE